MFVVTTFVENVRLVFPSFGDCLKTLTPCMCWKTELIWKSLLYYNFYIAKMIYQMKRKSCIEFLFSNSNSHSPSEPSGSRGAWGGLACHSVGSAGLLAVPRPAPWPPRTWGWGGGVLEGVSCRSRWWGQRGAAWWRPGTDPTSLELKLLWVLGELRGVRDVTNMMFLFHFIKPLLPLAFTPLTKVPKVSWDEVYWEGMIYQNQLVFNRLNISKKSFLSGSHGYASFLAGLQCLIVYRQTNWCIVHFHAIHTSLFH